MTRQEIAQEVIRELQEIADGNWMMARQPRLSEEEKQEYTRQAKVIEEAIDLLRQLPD